MHTNRYCWTSVMGFTLSRSSPPPSSAWSARVHTRLGGRGWRPNPRSYGTRRQCGKGNHDNHTQQARGIGRSRNHICELNFNCGFPHAISRFECAQGHGVLDPSPSGDRGLGIIDRSQKRPPPSSSIPSSERGIHSNRRVMLRHPGLASTG